MLRSLVHVGRQRTRYRAYDHTSYNLQVRLLRPRWILHMAVHILNGPQYKGLQFRCHKAGWRTMEEVRRGPDPLAGRESDIQPLEIVGEDE